MKTCRFHSRQEKEEVERSQLDAYEDITECGGLGFWGTLPSTPTPGALGSHFCGRH